MIGHPLCLLGLHHPGYQPATRNDRDTSWLQLRVCTRCGRPVERRHR